MKNRMVFLGGDEEIRTLDPLRARQVLSQLSYIPIIYVIFHLRFYSFIDELIFFARSVPEAFVSQMHPDLHRFA